MSDSETSLFGDAMETTVAVVPHRIEEEVVTVVADSGRFPIINSESRVVKLPSSALSIDFDGFGSKKSANLIQCRSSEDGTLESNTRLIEWEDGSWSMVVGSEHFRVIERPEDVALFDSQPSGYYVSMGSIKKQFNIIPATLDSRTHRHVVEQSTVARKLNETRKVALAHGLAASTGGGSVNSFSVQPSSDQSGKRGGQKLTAAFLEAGLSGSTRKDRSVRDIKAAYKKPRLQEENEDDERQSDVDFIDDEEDGSDGSSSSGGSSSSSSSSSGDSSSSDDSSSSN